jgi:4-hydroxy-4-methyl-2-oxoglutarate aldolase
MQCRCEEIIRASACITPNEKESSMKMIRNSLLTGFAFATLYVSGIVFGQTPPAKAVDQAAELRGGKGYIATQVFSLEDDKKILALFDGLRVADVSDGMDKAGLHNTGLMSPDIRPLWKDTVNFSHRFIGIAVTARYVPSQNPPAGKMNPQDFDKWEGQWYSQKSSEPFIPLLRDGSALVIEEAGETDVGSIGSNNILTWKGRGMAGLVTSNSARDTDEIIAQKVPLYFQKPGRGIRPGRNEIESVNRPIVCGGVLVKPGDVIVADGDGVIVVPRAVAQEVARYAREVIDKDKAARTKLYEKLGMPKDKSVNR